MSALGERIKALEEVVRHVKNAWNDVILERDRLKEENTDLRKRLNIFEGRMQESMQNEILQVSEVANSGNEKKEFLLEAKKEIRTYIAEIDRCLETLNSI